MAITATRVGNLSSHIIGAIKMTFTDVQMDSSYPTGGEPLTPADLGLSSVIAAIATVKVPAGTVNQAQAYYDVANQKLVVYDETPAEVANAADLSTTTYRVVAFGN